MREPYGQLKLGLRTGLGCWYVALLVVRWQVDQSCKSMIPQLYPFCLGRMEASSRRYSWERRIILLCAGCHCSCHPADLGNLGKLQC